VAGAGRRAQMRLQFERAYVLIPFLIDYRKLGVPQSCLEFEDVETSGQKLMSSAYSANLQSRAGGVTRQSVFLKANHRGRNLQTESLLSGLKAH
jgi:hypothetical protein